MEAEAIEVLVGTFHRVPDLPKAHGLEEKNNESSRLIGARPACPRESAPLLPP
jgi:hypothetical protein